MLLFQPGFLSSRLNSRFAVADDRDLHSVPRAGVDEGIEVTQGLSEHGPDKWVLVFGMFKQ
jgi:hypothetical protein